MGLYELFKLLDACSELSVVVYNIYKSWYLLIYVVVSFLIH
jgi:hypothetical protein